ncbi:MAG: TRAP transporter large permease subunit [Deltaproteobacteria bacterium]|nr:TRAP transporter large permease subunit [Deltaproteobacteria bacterium]
MYAQRLLLSFSCLEAPILIGMGVNPMAAHLFIFYFCALSLITPPICTTSFTAAAIAGSSPMKTGLEAVRFGIVLYTLPYLFVYSPALLFVGSPFKILYVFIIAGIGVFALAIGAQGHFLRVLNWFKRLLLVCASILIFWPNYVLTILGVALLTSLLFYERHLAMRAARAATI